MRHALTLDQPPPLPLAAGRRRVVSRFRLAHVGLAALHLVQALVVLAVAGGMVVDVTHEVGAGRTETLTGVSIGAAMAAYFLAASVNHLLSATILNSFYEADLRRGRNRLRWAEYAVGATILMLVIALYVGLTDVTALVVVGAATIVMICCGWMQEALNPPGRQATTMVPFWAGVVASCVPWAIVAVEMIDNSATPSFGVSIFLSLFILWTSFGANQWLQYQQIGPWADYMYGERTYLALSLVAKSALAWQIVAGTSFS